MSLWAQLLHRRPRRLIALMALVLATVLIFLQFALPNLKLRDQIAVSRHGRVQNEDIRARDVGTTDLEAKPAEQPVSAPVEPLNPHKCRLYEWSADYVVDSKGQVCDLAKVSRGGCCIARNPGADVFGPFSCTSCDIDAACCTSFPFCVSCCLNATDTVLFGPEYGKDPAKSREIIEAQMDPKHVYNIDLNDRFAICGIKCRTSSRSVVHQNRYRSDWRFCYGHREPPLRIST